MSAPLVYVKISGDDAWSDELEVTDFDFAVAVWGTFTASVYLQIKPMWRDVAADWIDLELYGSPGFSGSVPVKGACRVRIGVPVGLFSGGDVFAALYRGEDDSRRTIVSKKYIA